MGGISDFFSNLADFGEMIGDSLKELGNIASDTVEEGKELFGEGFVEMVIKDNNNYKTSFEIKDEADRIVRQQDERYNLKIDETNGAIHCLNEHITVLYKKKIKLAERIQVKIGQKEFISTNVTYNSGARPEPPSFDRHQNRIFDIVMYNNFVKSEPAFFPSLPESLFGTSRKEAANEYREDAKDYEVYVSGKIAEMNRVKVAVELLEQRLREEDKILDVLENSLDMQRESTYEEVAKQLETLLIQHIFGENGSENQTYIAALRRLENICEQI
jgi:hypothetical protein